MSISANPEVGYNAGADVFESAVQKKALLAPFLLFKTNLGIS